MTQEEITKLEDFATALIIAHDRHVRLFNEINKELIDVSNKLMSLYVEIRSEIRQQTKQERDL